MTCLRAVKVNRILKLSVTIIVTEKMAVKWLWYLLSEEIADLVRSAIAEG
jgi:hypothetical protein